MADNYLENKMMEHMASKGAPAGKTRRPESLPLNYPLPKLRMVFFGDITPLVFALVENLAPTGMRMAVFSDSPEAAGLRERAGVMIVSSDATLRGLAYDWRGLDVVVTTEALYSGALSRLLDAAAHPTCCISRDVRLLTINPDGFILHTPLSPEDESSGEVVVKRILCEKDMVRLLKWIIAPQNLFAAGLNFIFS